MVGKTWSKVFYCDSIVVLERRGRLLGTPCEGCVTRVRCGKGVRGCHDLEASTFLG